MMAKLDAVSHHWVASLANYNYQLYYRVGKTNIDTDALSRVSWPACMPDTLGTHYLVTAAPVHVRQEDDSQSTMGNLIIHYGLLEKILSDQRRNFENELIADLCRLMGIKKLRNSLDHPQMNGLCERFYSTLISMLGTLPPECKSNWKSSIAVLVHTYNCTWNSSTGFIPYFLMYGRQPWLSTDVSLG